WQSELARQRLACMGEGLSTSSSSPSVLASSHPPSPSSTTVPALPPLLGDWLARWIENGADPQLYFDAVQGGVRRVARVLGHATRGDWVILLEEFDDAA